MNKKPKSRNWVVTFLLFATVGVGLFSSRPIAHVIKTSSTDEDQRIPLPEGMTDDASRLNRTAVRKIWNVPISEDPERQLADLLSHAHEIGLRVSIAGAQHSMGGHTIYPDGIVINMLPFNRLELDADENILTAQSGALWEDIIPYLDKHKRSVAVMQSNNSFSIGGSISVNCHGWQFGRAPIASTVLSMRVMLADGTIMECSRDKNRELFSLVLGGYGLFGIILDVKLRVVPNERYRFEQHIVPVAEAFSTFDAKIKDQPDLQMAYARMNIVPSRFLDHVILNAFFSEEGEIPMLTKPGIAKLRRAIFRGSAQSDYGKELRWAAETKIQPLLAGKVFSRNQLLNEGVEIYENRSADSTDILHEYFVPRRTLASFVGDLRRIIPKNNADLLNVTVRSIKKDEDTFLRYATEPMIALVMLFVQETTDEGERRMEIVTQQLIDSAIKHNGRYYLPYRLHATPNQFHRAYPQAKEFFRKKLDYDPNELFQNRFYLKYAKN